MVIDFQRTHASNAWYRISLSGNEPASPWFLIALLWLSSCAMGGVGTVGIAIAAFSSVSAIWKITVGFFSIPLFFVFIFCVSITCNRNNKDRLIDRIALRVFFLFSVALLFYMDWLLAAITGNWWGSPKDLAKADRCCTGCTLV